MRLETKFVQVPNDPRHINAVNQLASIWGWSVQNIQVTDTKITYEGDSHGWMTDYGYSGTTEIITERTTYASITYQRDMDDPTTPKLTELELEYNRCHNLHASNFLNENDSTEYQIWRALTDNKELDIFIAKALVAATVICVLIAYFGILLPKMDIVSFGCLGGAVIFFAKAYLNPVYHSAKKNEAALCKKGDSTKHEMMERIMHEAKLLRSR